ncbi:Tn3 family transposase [Streptomyces sp. NPDC088729]|uniref:Tn3 family transposase n=1 Tax=Streptomyces sp. NPDC088729 TaxID=3365876 RepID=UPI0037FD9EB1
MGRRPVTGTGLRRARCPGPRAAHSLEAELDQRLPVRGIPEHLARAAHWTGWWHRLGPLSGSDPKPKEPPARYVVTAFTYASGLGATQAARHMSTVSAHEPAAIAKRHRTPKNLARAGADLIDSLLQNPSAAQLEQVHTDTQGQSFPVFGLAHLLGIDLLPRIRNFQDLTFHRPAPETRYRHIDQLFSTDTRTAIDWDLIHVHWPDLTQVAATPAG